MNDFDRPTPLPSELRSLIEADRRHPGMSPDAKRRVLGRIGAGFLAGSVATVVATSTAKATAVAGAGVVGTFVARKGSIAIAAFFLGGLGGALGIGVALKMGVAPAPSHSALTPTTVPVVASIVVRPLETKSTVAVPAPSTPDTPDTPDTNLVASATTNVPTPMAIPLAKPTTAAAANASISSKDTDLASERVLIEMARSALAHGAPDQALAAVAKHQGKYPSGQLSEERESIAVHALAAAGRMDEARARAKRFRMSYPKSLFLAGIDAAVGADP